ncbi:MAG TPA: hypothetical protein ENK41_00945 [Rhodobacteraceae bacterium]|nr:hypothetical protein [Paracoccaceae bacterium]
MRNETVSRGVRLAALVLLAPLIGCSMSVGNLFGSRDEKPDLATSANCPRIATLADASSLSVFAPGRRASVENLAYEADITRVLLDCKVKDQVVTADFGLAGRVNLGPRGEGGKKTLPIFAALTLGDKKIITRLSRDSVVTIDPDNRTGKFYEVIEKYSFTMAPGKKPQEYEILVGFRLTPAQLDYNRKK